MKKVTEIVAELATPVVEENGCRLWDVEYVREAGQWYLRLYLDKDGGVDILDCEAVSRKVSDLLDEVDPIEGSYMFGSILAMDRSDVALSVGLSIAVLVLFGIFYHKLFAITFDESFSRATGVKVGLYNTLLSVLTALTIVLGMRMMGAMLISSLVIFPALSAMRIRKSFRGVVICAGIMSVISFCVGLTLSYLVSTPVGATVVVVNLAVFLLCCAAAAIRKR